VKVLGSAMEPGVEREDMLGEAEDLLEASLVQTLPSILFTDLAPVIQKIESGKKAKWTDANTKALSKSLADALKVLEKNMKKLDDTVPDSTLTNAFEKVDLLMVQQEE